MASKMVLKTVGYPSSMRYNNSVGDCPAVICELFADLFESAYNVDTRAQIMKMCLAHPMVVVSAAIGFACPIWKLHILASMRTGEPGNDGVPPSFVKLCADGLKSPFLHIFHLSLSIGVFPSKWKDSFLIPIFKTSKQNVGNYCGVAILSCFAKLFEVTVGM
jgi:hypothetical protein